MQAMNKKHEFDLKFSRSHIFKEVEKKELGGIKFNNIFYLSHIQNINTSTYNQFKNHCGILHSLRGKGGTKSLKFSVHFILPAYSITYKC